MWPCLSPYFGLRVHVETQGEEVEATSTHLRVLPPLPTPAFSPTWGRFSSWLHSFHHLLQVGVCFRASEMGELNFQYKSKIMVFVYFQCKCMQSKKGKLIYPLAR